MFYSFFFVLSFCISSYSQNNSEDPPIGNSELGLFNYTGQNLEVTLIPISVLFNGYNQQTFISRKRTNPFDPNKNNTNYINGTYVVWDQQLNEYVKKTKILTGSTPTLTSSWNDDYGEGSLLAFGNVGFGRYKIII